MEGPWGKCAVYRIQTGFHWDICSAVKSGKLIMEQIETAVSQNTNRREDVSERSYGACV